MKKFTKGCLMTALVLFITGLIICGVSGLLGGFRQLWELDGIGSIPFGYYRDAMGDWRIGFFSSAGYDENYPESCQTAEEIERKLEEVAGQKEQLALTAESLGSLDIDVENCDVLILESADEYVWFLADGNTDRPRYKIENDDGRSGLTIENDHDGYWRNRPNDTVYLWLPKACALEECEVSLGAGYMKSIYLQADQIKMSVGAGLLEVDGLEGNETGLFVGAGELLAGRITAGKADLEIGSGHLGIQELSVSGEVDLKAGMGQIDIGGRIDGDLDLECSMGTVVLCLEGSEDDHSYDVECGMGEIVVGGREFGAFATKRSWNSGKNSEFEIDCSMGSVTVTFEE